MVFSREILKKLQYQASYYHLSTIVEPWLSKQRRNLIQVILVLNYIISLRVCWHEISYGYSEMLHRVFDNWDFSVLYSIGKWLTIKFSVMKVVGYLKCVEQCCPGGVFHPVVVVPDLHAPVSCDTTGTVPLTALCPQSRQ